MSWLLVAIKRLVSRAFPWAAGCHPALANYFLLTPVPPALLIGGIITHFPSLKAAAGWVLAVGMGTAFLPSTACLSAAGGGVPATAGSDLDRPSHPVVPPSLSLTSTSAGSVWMGVLCFGGVLVLCLLPSFIGRGRGWFALAYVMSVCGLWCNDGRGDSTEKRCFERGGEDKEALGG